MSPKTELLVFRHGKTDYTEEGLDLTLDGIEETRTAARTLAESINSFDELIILTSPLARTRGTATVIMEELGQTCSPKAMNIIRCVDIKDFAAFVQFQQEHDTETYGEMWLNNPILAEENDITESRASVKKRSLLFLRLIQRFLRTRNQYGISTCVLAITHFEIGTYYLAPLFPQDSYPSPKNPAFANSEIIRICCEPNNSFTISARGVQAVVQIVNNNIINISEQA